MDSTSEYPARLIKLFLFGVAGFHHGDNKRLQAKP